MYKAGDKFEIVESAYLGDYWKKGNIVEFVKPYDNLEGVYEFKKPGSSDGYRLNFGIEGDTHFHSTVRPCRTEAEKRGAKFGMMGVVIEDDKSMTPYKVQYNDGSGSDYIWCRLASIKPYEAN